MVIRSDKIILFNSVFYDILIQPDFLNGIYLENWIWIMVVILILFFWCKKSKRAIQVFHQSHCGGLIDRFDVLGYANLSKVQKFLVFEKLIPYALLYIEACVINFVEYLIVSKFRNDRVDIVDFLIKAYFCKSTH